MRLNGQLSSKRLQPVKTIRCTQNYSKLRDVHKKIDEILKTDGTVNGIFKPSKYLGKGCFGVTYLGKKGLTKKIIYLS